MLRSLGVDLLNFALGDFPGVDAGDTLSFAMNGEGDLGRFPRALVEQGLENLDDEIHGGVVVIVQQDLVLLGPPSARALAGRHGDVGVISEGFFAFTHAIVFAITWSPRRATSTGLAHS